MADKTSRVSQVKDGSPFVKLPRELQLRIFKELLTYDPKARSGSYINLDRQFLDMRTTIAGEKKTTCDLLQAYASLCKELRQIALIAFYESNILSLKMIHDVDLVNAQRKGIHHPQIRDTWDRFGKIYIDNDGREALGESLRPPKDAPRYQQSQYGIKLPPEQTRSFFRAIELYLDTPGNRSSWSLEWLNGKREVLTTKTVRFDDEENDWLAPVFRIHNMYAFARAARVTVRFDFPTYLGQLNGENAKMKSWIMDRRNGNEEISERLKTGMLTLVFPWE